MVLLYAPGFTPEVIDNTPPMVANQHTWFGWDGTEWDLSHGLSGLGLQAGVRGMEDPPIIRYSSKSPAVAGSLFRGATYDEREVFWPLKVFSDGGSLDWIAHNKRFRRTLNVEQPGQWVVTQPSGERRTLTVRYVGLQDDAWDIDPALVGTSTYGFNLVAENPFWMGDPTEPQVFDNKTAQNFYGGASGGGYGPPYFLSSGTLIASASIINPGDVAVWPTWTVYGPSTTATVNGVTFPMALDDGEWVTINTDPTDQVALNQGGVDVTSQLINFQNFREIPPGDPVPLSISMTGNGRISIVITPAYLRAI